MKAQNAEYADQNAQICSPVWVCTYCICVFFLSTADEPVPEPVKPEPVKPRENKPGKNC